MLDRVVSYLRAHGVSFRLSSQPSPALHPSVLRPISPGGQRVETGLLLAASGEQHGDTADQAERKVA